jgi:hypothetical protein
LFKKKTGNSIFTAEISVESRSCKSSKDHDVIVDEVAKPTPHPDKKQKNHIGEYAFLPITL